MRLGNSLGLRSNGEVSQVIHHLRCELDLEIIEPIENEIKVVIQSDNRQKEVATDLVNFRSNNFLTPTYFIICQHQTIIN